MRKVNKINNCILDNYVESQSRRDYILVEKKTSPLNCTTPYGVE